MNLCWYFSVDVHVCINQRRFFLCGPFSKLLVCSLNLDANVSNSMKKFAEKEWGVVYSKIILTYEGKNIVERQNA